MRRRGLLGWEASGKLLSRLLRPRKSLPYQSSPPPFAVRCQYTTAQGPLSRDSTPGTLLACPQGGQTSVVEAEVLSNPWAAASTSWAAGLLGLPGPQLLLVLAPMAPLSAGHAQHSLRAESRAFPSLVPSGTSRPPKISPAHRKKRKKKGVWGRKCTGGEGVNARHL